MKLTIYKGFDKKFLETLHGDPLVDNDVEQKINVLENYESIRKKLSKALALLDEDDSVWITYEEYALINKKVRVAVEEDDLIVKIYNNNLYPDYYPLDFTLSDELVEEILDTMC